MKQIKSMLAVVLICTTAQYSFGQKNLIEIPDVEGYYTLKADFHMHTVFSDGHVWPTFRVHEALRDGLDAIAITEHMDYEGFPDELSKDYNKSHEIASEAAKSKGLIVIRGVEISPRVPPYHHNAIFLKDANSFPLDYMENTQKQFVMKEDLTQEQLMAPFLEAKDQDAFVSYNHPSYGWWDKKDTLLFTAFHQELLKKGILKGVEVVNSGRYNVIAHKMAIQYNLTMLCNTDEHYDLYPRYAESHRPMTLVFAKEKTEKGIKEALLGKRTALFFGDFIIARPKESQDLFNAITQFVAQKKNTKGELQLAVTIKNKSDIPLKLRIKGPYDWENLPLGRLDLKGQEEKEVLLKAVWNYPESVDLEMEIENFLVDPDHAFQTKVTIPIQDL